MNDDSAERRADGRWLLRLVALLVAALVVFLAVTGVRIAREGSAVLILKGIDFACLNLRLRVSAPKGSKALSPPWIPYLFWEPIQRLLSASVCRMP